MSVSEKEDLQRSMVKSSLALNPNDSEVSERKISILGLHDKVSTLTFILDTFMKEMKGTDVEDVVVDEEIEEKRLMRRRRNCEKIPSSSHSPGLIYW